MERKDIINAWATIREENNTIPDEVIDFMKYSALAALSKEAPQDNSGLRENLIKFLMTIDECYAMHIRENAERCVDNYLGESGKEAPQVAVECYVKLMEAQDRYIIFLSNEFNKAYSIANFHHYRSRMEDIEKGQQLREEIEQLKKTTLSQK